MIEAFEKYIQKEIYTDSFDNKMAEEYLHFIKLRKPLKGEKEAYRQSTIRYYYRKTIAAINKARKDGYKVEVNALESLKVTDEDSCSIYLNEAEINRLCSLNIMGEEAQVRDLFVLGCCTALRYSDYSSLSEDNFISGSINVNTKKTNTWVTIPIHPFIKEIIKRNKGYEFLCYSKSQQNFNRMIKKICKRARINDNILIERTEGFKTVHKVYKKYELVSSHTARRSGATNMYLAGIPPFRIMLITGHKTESAFYCYIRIRREENAKILQDHPFFRGNV